MPKIVSREARREDVCAAAVRVLARGGPSALTLRSLAAELGGSITLVTYFFDDKADLFEAIVDGLLEDYSDSEVLAPTADARADLRKMVDWFIPANAEEDEREAGRIAMISMRATSTSVDHFYIAMEQKFREMFTRTLARLVPDADVETLVDFLRAGLNGLVLAATEHPEIWDTARRDRYRDALLTHVESFRTTSAVSA
ncbi:TetR/AcrR family transcriptional regulator [Microbacterium sp. PMB16]|uniref:TetR/AcrR family transcriptional regulator n=1 Tax=Microbacterium sp. PMB16 TaxID=3120157 RepID=UPI003F4C0002